MTLPKIGNTYRIWKVVEELVVNRYDRIKEEGMRGSHYLLREWINQRVEAGELDREEFEYFLDKQEYYRDDFWPRIEKKHGLKRPYVRPPTVVIEDGKEYTEQHIAEAWSRNRGFIFVEKSGMAEQLKPLSNHGWLIISAKGESTRTFREKASNDNTDRPILAITDADHYGDGITDTLEGHSKRTEHLELWRDLEDRVQTIGLSEADADVLDLPKERDPTKSPDEWRTELNSMAVLRERHGIEQPLLSYTLVKMNQFDIPIYPLPIEEPRTEVEESLKTGIRRALSDSIDAVVESVLDGVDVTVDLDDSGEGELMRLMRRGENGSSVDLDELTSELETVATDRLDRLFWERESAYADMVIEEAGKDDYAHIEEALA